MDLMQTGTQLLSRKLGNGVNSGCVTSVLGSLLSASDVQANLGGITAVIQGKGLGAIAESWLGDGDNADISADQVREVIGNDKITEMASQLNTDEGSLLDSPGELPGIAMSVGCAVHNMNQLLACYFRCARRTLQWIFALIRVSLDGTKGRQAPEPGFLSIRL